MNTHFLPRIFNDKGRFKEDFFGNFDINSNLLTGMEYGNQQKHWKVIYNDYNILADDEALFVDTSVKPIILTLPANPKMGHSIDILDYYGTWDKNNLIVRNNGNLILGINDNFVCDMARYFLCFTFDNTNSWNILVRK